MTSVPRTTPKARMENLMPVTNDEVAGLIANQNAVNEAILAKLAALSGGPASVNAEEAAGKAEFQKIINDAVKDALGTVGDKQTVGTMKREVQEGIAAAMADAMGKKAGVSLIRETSTWKSLYNDAWDFAEAHPWFTGAMLLTAALGAVVGGYTVYSWVASRVNVSIDMVGDEDVRRLKAM